MPRDLDLDRLAFHGLFQIQLQGVAQVRTPGVAATTAATKDVAEYIAEDIREAGTAASESAATGLAVNAGVAELVVGSPLGRLCQYFVGFAGLLELVLGFGVVRVTVGVVLHGELSVGSLDFLLVRVPGNPENLVIIALGHAFKTLFLNAENAGISPRFPTT